MEKSMESDGRIRVSSRYLPVSPGPLVSSAVASSALAMSPSEMPVPLEGGWGVLDPLSLWETSKNHQKRWKNHHFQW